MPLPFLAPLFAGLGSLGAGTAAAALPAAAGTAAAGTAAAAAPALAASALPTAAGALAPTAAELALGTSGIASLPTMSSAAIPGLTAGAGQTALEAGMATGINAATNPAAALAGSGITPALPEMALGTAPSATATGAPQMGLGPALGPNGPTMSMGALGAAPEAASSGLGGLASKLTDPTTLMMLGGAASYLGQGSGGGEEDEEDDGNYKEYKPWSRKQRTPGDDYNTNKGEFRYFNQGGEVMPTNFVGSQHPMLTPGGHMMSAPSQGGPRAFAEGGGVSDPTGWSSGEGRAVFPGLTEEAKITMGLIPDPKAMIGEGGQERRSGGTFRYAEGGMVGEQDIVAAAISAVEGTHPNPKEAVAAFIREFGAPAFERLLAQLQAEGGQAGQPRAITGPGDGTSDDVPATIDGKEPAALSSGEFVVPADVVSGLGNGDTKGGIEALHDMMTRVRAGRTGSAQQPPDIDPQKVMPA